MSQWFWKTRRILIMQKARRQPRLLHYVEIYEASNAEMQGETSVETKSRQ
jgi:hypothetical protein